MFRALTLLLAGVFIQIHSGNSQPVIRIIEGTNLNLHKLYEGRSVVRELTVQNTGDAPLNIRNVRTSCGCTVAKLASNVIPSGGSEKLTVTFESREAQGRFKREVYISSNDTAHPELVITVRGTIVTIIQVRPRYISFGTQHVHVPSLQVVQLKNTLSDTIRVLECRSPDPQIRANLPDSLLIPGRAVNLDVQLMPAKKGDLLGQLELTTDSHLKPVVKISYVGTIR